MSAAAPILHVIFGPSGAGKSTYAADLARRERAVVFSIDDWMARLFAQD
ncbi:MAG: AAA family ATPase, partial [Phenylobacterium sp.]